jgi:hypothetical protein
MELPALRTMFRRRPSISLKTMLALRKIGELEM